MATTLRREYCGSIRNHKWAKPIAIRTPYAKHGPMFLAHHFVWANGVFVWRTQLHPLIFFHHGCSNVPARIASPNSHRFLGLARLSLEVGNCRFAFVSFALPALRPHAGVATFFARRRSRLMFRCCGCAGPFSCQAFGLAQVVFHASVARCVGNRRRNRHSLVFFVFYLYVRCHHLRFAWVVAHAGAEPSCCR